MIVESAEPITRRAVLVEDDEGVRRALQLFLHWRGFDVRSFASLTPALGACLPEQIDVLVADYHLPDGTGIDIVRSWRSQGWNGRSILITGFSSDELRREAEAGGFDAILEKPLRQQSLLAAIDI